MNHSLRTQTTYEDITEISQAAWHKLEKIQSHYTLKKYNKIK